MRKRLRKKLDKQAVFASIDWWDDIDDVANDYNNKMRKYNAKVERYKAKVSRVAT